MKKAKYKHEKFKADAYKLQVKFLQQELEVRDAKLNKIASCMLSILDSLKLFDNFYNDSLELGDKTLSQMMFRKMKAYNIDLNKELGFTHLKPVKRKKK